MFAVSTGNGLSRSGRSLLCYCALLVLCTALVSCSMPDGPDPGELASEETIPETEQMEPDNTLPRQGQILPITATAEMRGEIFELEVAQGSNQQALGLMFRSALPDNRGMLFPFGVPRRASFWMKDVPVPLDMVFIRDGQVVAIASEVPPCPALPCPSYGPENALVDQVLELRSGRAAEIGLEPGDLVVIEALSTMP